MSKLVTGGDIQPTPSPVPPSNAHANGGNPCGYDSFLHATICTNNGHSVRHASSALPMHHSTPTKILQNYNNRHGRMRHKTHDLHHSAGLVTAHTSLTASPQVQGYTKLNSSAAPPAHQQQQGHPKLNTSALSQLNPQLTPEQKFSRTINHVEKWLNERDQVMLVKTNNTEPKATSHKTTTSGAAADVDIRTSNLVGKDEQKNHDNSINTKVPTSDKFPEKSSLDSPAKKTFNKEVLLLGPRKAKSHRSSGGGGVVVSAASSAALPPTEAAANKSQAMVQFGTIPLLSSGNRSECENLLRASCTEDSSGSQAEGETSTSSAVLHRYVHEHIHHHYHHFESSNEIV